MVYVLSKTGKPLMPCENVIARLLLKQNKTKVKRKTPFTIQLTYYSTEYTQEVTLGQDTGSKHVGTACVANGEVVYQSQVELRDDIKSKMDGRRQARRNRRNMKTRYRKARFLNRKNSTKLKRLPPSVKHRVQAHIDEIEFCKKILPISKIVLEVSQFDTALMKNLALISEKVKHWGYQKGFDYGFSSRREAILHRDSYTCQLCGKKHTLLEVHHIIWRSRGGSDDEDNLITLCHDCHDKIHKDILTVDKKPRKLNLKYATHMSIIRSQLLKVYPEAIETFGFVTKENRNHLSLSKDHYIDACVIASGGKSFKLNNEIFYKKRVARQDRQLCKGTRGEKKIPTYKLFGFKKFDKVKYFGKEYFIKGRRSAGTCTLMDIFNQVIDFSFMPKGWKTPKLSSCKRIVARTSTLVERRSVIPVLS